MDEQNWLAGCRVDAMLPLVRDRVSERTLRLFGCACCRRVWHELGSDCRLAVETAERFADGLISAADLQRAASAAFSREIFPARMLSGTSPALDAGYAAAAASSVGLSVHQAREAAESASLSEARAAGAACTKAFHTARRAARAAQAALLRYFVGNPFRQVTMDPTWLTPVVRALAESAHSERGEPCGRCKGAGRLRDDLFGRRGRYCPDCPGMEAIDDRTLDRDRLAVLSDVLEEAGCDEVSVLSHLRSPGPHYRGMWSLDVLLGMA